MKALLDEGVPKRLARLLGEKGHDVSGFPNAWKGLQNGKLLVRLRTEGFRCLITCDKNLIFQQNSMSVEVAILVLPTQDLFALVGMMDRISDALAACEIGVPVVLDRHGTFRAFG